LFNDAPKALMDKIEQVVRLIRSKAVGVYFVTQNPIDVPDKILGQLGNRVQHALRASRRATRRRWLPRRRPFGPIQSSTPARVIMELAKGEALVSFLEGGGTPSMSTRHDPAASARIDRSRRRNARRSSNASPVKGKYEPLSTPSRPTRCCRSASPAPQRPRSSGCRRRRRRHSGTDRRDGRNDFGPACRAAECRPSDHRAQRDPFGDQQGSRRPWLPI